MRYVETSELLRERGWTRTALGSARVLNHPEGQQFYRSSGGHLRVTWKYPRDRSDAWLKTFARLTQRADGWPPALASADGASNAIEVEEICRTLGWSACDYQQAGSIGFPEARPRLRVDEFGTQRTVRACWRHEVDAWLDKVRTVRRSQSND